MNQFQQFSLALRLLWREWRGGELRLLFLAILVAVCASCAVGFFSDRVEQAIEKRAVAFVGADLVLKTARPSSIAFEAQAAQQGLVYGEQLTFSSMLINDQQMSLAGIKVVDNSYPMKGTLRISQGGDQISEVTHPPQPGMIWVEPRLLESLNLQLGDQVQLGEKTFTISQLLLREPDRGGGFINLRPRAMMNKADIAATGVIQPGSRVSYRYLFNGNTEAINQIKNWITPQLNPGERFEELKNENRRVSVTLNRAKTYLNLAGLLAVIMAGVAVAMAARQYSQRHFDAAALFRCMGLQQQQIVGIFTTQLLLVGAVASLLGIIAGWLGQFGLIYLLASLIPGELPPASLTPALIGFCTGLLILFAAALPAILRLRQVAPLRVLRRDLTPLPASTWLVYGIFGLVVFGLLYLYSQDLKLTLIIGVGATALTASLGFLAWLCLKALPRQRGPMVWRLAIANLHRHPKDALAQMVAFGLTLGAMVLILIVRNDLLDRWQAQLPEQAPNNFLINIQPHQVAPLTQFFNDRDIDYSSISPMIRGRLSQINGQEANEFIGEDSPGRRATRRELNLTYSAELSPDNRILQGQWWTPDDRGKSLISIEQEFADDIGVKLGDSMTFDFGDQTVTATIASMRSLDWGSFRPNFYVIFHPGNLDNLPANFITSFYLPDSESAALSELIQTFPTLTLLEIGPVLKELRSIIQQVTTAVEYVLVFVLLAGVLVVISALLSSLDERLREGSLLRVLGGRTKTIRQLLLIEFAVIGFLAGCLAIAVDEAVSFGLFHFLFDLPYQPSYYLWLWVPLAGMVMVASAGLAGTRKVVKQPPLTVFRGLG